jgi:hypothetical protein
MKLYKNLLQYFFILYLLNLLLDQQDPILFLVCHHNKILQILQKQEALQYLFFRIYVPKVNMINEHHYGSFIIYQHKSYKTSHLANYHAISFINILTNFINDIF